MDQTRRPLKIPPEFAMYAEKHNIFEMYKVITLSFDILTDKIWPCLFGDNCISSECVCLRLNHREKEALYFIKR